MTAMKISINMEMGKSMAEAINMNLAAKRRAPKNIRVMFIIPNMRVLYKD